jgi:amidase
MAAVQLPTMEQLRAVARRCGLSLDDADLGSFRTLLTESIQAYNDVAAMADELPPVRHPRTPGYRPRPEDNKHNAWEGNRRL